MKTLTITDEAVKRAAEKCSTAKEVLKNMFPEVFEEPNKKSQIHDDFVNDLAALMNRSNKFSYELWKKIPGNYSSAKASAICDLILNTYWHETNI